MVGITDSSRLSIIIQEQVKILLRMVYGYKDNIPALKNKLSEYKAPENKTFKEESISFALEHMIKHPSKFPKELCEVIYELLSSKSLNIEEDKAFSKKGIQNIQTNLLSAVNYEDAPKDGQLNDETLGLNLSMKRAIDNNNIKEIISLGIRNTSLGKDRMEIDGKPPLEYALTIGKNDLALKMMQEGFVANYSSKAEPSSINDAIQNILRRRSGRVNMVQDILDSKAVEGRSVKR